MNKSFKEKVKENRGKIIAGVIFGVTIIGGGYVIYDTYLRFLFTMIHLLIFYITH